MSAQLRLNRLVVIRGGKRVYDQAFHKGLNIIRGTNGSGKSTIMDLIFFSLGGELEKWKETTLLCDEVIAEIIADGKVLVLKREIAKEKNRPIRIFFGKFDEAIISAADGWVHAPYARNDNSKSFSQIIFEALGMPEMSGDEGSNITMHQILRLMYVDQATPFQRIFRSEPRFDTKDIRRAIGELLCGIGEYDLYAAKLKRRNVKAKLDEAKTKLQNLLKAVAAIGESLHEDTLNKEIQKKIDKRNQLFQKIKSLETEEINNKEVAKDAESQRKQLFHDMSSQRSDLIKLEQQLESIQYEALDSQKFIIHLKNQIEELESASLTYVTLGAVEFLRCPACFGHLTEQEGGQCHLCGSEQKDEDRKSKVLSLKLDFEGQLAESERLMVKRRESMESITKRLSGMRRNLTRLTSRLDTVSAAPVDGRSALISETSREMGMAEARIEELEKLKDLSNEIMKLSMQKEKLAGELSVQEDLIETLQRTQDRRRQTVIKAITKETKRFLGLDLKNHNDFEKLEKFAFDFEDDWFAVNGEPNISTSASGMVVLKNSLFLGILFSALSDRLMRFPKLLLLDNVEDKGMVEERVRNFQAIIADNSKEATADHQIIITTSTINKDIETDDYVIGVSYTRENRTLKI